MVKRCRLLALIVIVLVAACNQRHPIQENSVDVGPTVTVAPIPAPPPANTNTLSMFALRPRGLIGGSSARGIVVLTRPAPAGGTTVTLSTTDPALGVPPAVIVAAGQESAEFALTTQPVPSEREAAVTAAVPERSASASFTLWNVEPMFFSFAHDDPLFSGVDPARRVLPPAATFVGFCNTNIVEFRIAEGARDSWVGRVNGTANRPLARGTYVVAAAGARPSISLGGTGMACTGGYNGQFTVREADYQANGTVNRFWASFDLRCNNAGSPPLHGDVRFGGVATGFPPTTVGVSCMLP